MAIPCKRWRACSVTHSSDLSMIETYDTRVYELNDVIETDMIGRTSIRPEGQMMDRPSSILLLMYEYRYFSQPTVFIGNDLQV
jgi:hypothetical protein